mmetsp:Transcript_40696/g.65412  ORF Transcript_40696/g.65412 Transcript_40696/m.65412 type:complete len:465 (+) Transcript_40696:202-1596(+)
MSSPGSLWNIRNLVTGAVAAVGTLATFKLVLDYRSYKNASQRRKVRMEEKKRRRVEAEPSARLPTDQELLGASFSAVKELEKQQQKQHQDRRSGVPLPVKEDRQLTCWLRSMGKSDLDDYKPKTRLLSARYLQLFYQSKCAQARSPESYKAAVDGHRADLEIAWKLLQCSPEEGSDEEVAVRLLALKVAKLLKDHQRMLPLFDSILARMKGPDPVVVIQEALAAFTTAPYLGRWESTRELGQLCIANGVKLDDLHEMSQENPEIPDLQTLFGIAQRKVPGLSDKDVPPQKIRWTEYLIKGLRIKTRSVECDDEKKKQEVQENFEAEIDSFREINVPSETKIVRSGAISQMLSFSMDPIPMVGPASDSKMLVRGFVNTAGGRRHEEIQIDIDEDNKEIWSGRYSCRQEFHPRVNLEVDIEIRLEERRQQQQQQQQYIETALAGTQRPGRCRGKGGASNRTRPSGC